MALLKKVSKTNLEFETKHLRERMIKKNLLGVMALFFGFFVFTGCDALTGERHPIPSGNYKVPQTQQLQRGGDYFANDALQQSKIMRMRQGVPFDWNE